MGCDAGKRIRRRKRHIVTDTGGFLVGIVVHRADIQDRDAAPAVLGSINATDPLLRHVFADGGHAGPRLRGAMARIGRWTLQIDKRSDPAPGLELIPRRRVVERTFAGLDRCRRMAKDRAKPIAPAKAWRRIAHIRRRIRVPQENDIIQKVSNRTFRPGCGRDLKHNDSALREDAEVSFRCIDPRATVLIFTQK